MEKDRFAQIYAERIDNYVSDYLASSILSYEYENLPLTLKERTAIENTMFQFADNFVFDEIIFKNFLGETIYEAYSKAFDSLYDGGKKQSCIENATRMKAKGYATQDIVEITGLTTEEIGMLRA